MARCPNGHEQRLGLKCSTCGASISYETSVNELRRLPKVEPDYGKVSILTVGCPRLPLRADYVGEVKAGQEDLKTSTLYQVGSIRGGSWLEFQKKYLADLRRWMTLIGIGQSTDRFLVVDTTSPLSVLALSALPKFDRTAVIAIAADQDSTPMEQNTSYVALSLALKRGFPIVGMSETFEKEMLYYTEDRGFAAGIDAMSRLFEPFIATPDDLMDLLERDAKLGVRMHSLSAIVAGSKNVYGIATNAFMAQSNNISIASKSDEYRTVHSLVFSQKETQGEFEKSFGVFRSRKYKAALSAELRFREVDSPLYDLMTLYGMPNVTALQSMAVGYETILESAPDLAAEGVS